MLGCEQGEQKINPVHYLQPTSYQVTSLRENIINLPTNNSSLTVDWGANTHNHKHTFTHLKRWDSFSSL